jgi:hypothetical protein
LYDEPLISIAFTAFFFHYSSFCFIAFPLFLSITSLVSASISSRFTHLG